MDAINRGQTSPIAALAALFAVCAGLSLYATTLDSVTPSETTNELAEPTLERVYDAIHDGGVVSPSRLTRATQVGPEGYRVAVAVATPDGRWTNGRRPPREADGGVDSAVRPVSVATGHGDVVWGRVRVWVWR
ncbi:hypothetical protein DVK02_02100 [Halobellus sp. Atlit-31R]|nr:hypothetical protein DVK02_02100 [Halobellus sp. Atlit-31R]